MRFWEEHVKVNYVGDKEKGNVGYSIPFPGANERPEIRLEGGFLELDEYGTLIIQCWPCSPLIQQAYSRRI